MTPPPPPPPPPSAPEDQATTLAVVVARLDDVREDIREMRTSVEASAAGKVGRGEWEQRNRAVDTRFEAQGREIAELRTTVEARRSPWHSVAAVVVAGAALAWSVFGPP